MIPPNPVHRVLLMEELDNNKHSISTSDSESLTYLEIPKEKRLRPGKPFLRRFNELVARAKHDLRDLSIENMDLLFSNQVDPEIRRRFLLNLVNYPGKISSDSKKFNQDSLNKWAAFENSMQIIPPSAKSFIDTQKGRHVQIDEIYSAFEAQLARKSGKGIKVLCDSLYTPTTAKALGAILLCRNRTQGAMSMQSIADYLNSISIPSPGNGEWLQPTVSRKIKQLGALRKKFNTNVKLDRKLNEERTVISDNRGVYLKLKENKAGIEPKSTKSRDINKGAREQMPITLKGLVKATPKDQIKTKLVFRVANSKKIAPNKLFILRIYDNEEKLQYLQKVDFNDHKTIFELDLWRDCLLLPGRYHIVFNDTDNLLNGSEKGEDSDEGYAPLYREILLGRDLYLEKILEYPVNSNGKLGKDDIKLRLRYRKMDQKVLVADLLRSE